MSIKLKNEVNFLAFLLIGVFLLLLSSFFVAIDVNAATSTVRGRAWWGNTNEYVSFNCLDDNIGELLDISGNLIDGFHFYSAPCSDLVHGVYIGIDDNFYGKAWNNNLGLISYDADTTPPDNYAFNVNCTNTCNLANNCWACYNESQQKIYGWARVVNDGTWLRMDGNISLPVKLQSWDLGNPVWPGHSIPSGDFVGDATSTIGNLSFNCLSEGGGSGACTTRNYKVYIGDLDIGSLSAPNWNHYQACSGAANSAVLRWYKASGHQTAYEIVINDSDNLSTSTAVCWSGKKTSSVAGQYILPNTDPNCNSLLYNSNYYWWIRLYDEDDNATSWFQYNDNSVTDTDLNIDNNTKTFTTYKHEFPDALFTWMPLTVLVGTTTDFTSNSQYYTSSSPSTAQNCSGGSCSYLWTTTDSGAIISAATNSTTSIIFSQATGTTVVLDVTDTDNYTCSTSTVLNVNYDLPIWREIKAK